MSKYYTSKLSEFYIGFEYESKHVQYIYPKLVSLIIGGKDISKPAIPEEIITWRKEVYEGHISIRKESFENEYGDWYCSIEDDIENKEVRTKYLDKQDIKELGFIYDNELKFPNGKYKPSITEYIKNDICLSTIHEDGTILITRYINGQFDKLFEGEIKNKSELAKLLVQLKIKE